MSKPALGRGLGELMSGQKVPANFPTTAAPTSNPVPEDSVPAETTEPVLEATPGVGTLLRGKTEASRVEASNPFAEPAPEPKSSVDTSFLKWILIIADILLVGPTSFFMLTKTTKMTFLEGTLCVVTFAFAACLGCLALYLHRQEKK